MSGETIWCHFVLANFLNDDIMTIMNSYWIDSVFTHALKHSASSRVCLICTGTGLLLLWWFSTVFICKSRQTTNVSEMERICSCSTFDGAEQSFIADQNALQERSHNTYKVNILEKKCDSAMNYSAPSNVEQEQILSISLTFVVCLLLQIKTVEECHGKS